MIETRASQDKSGVCLPGTARHPRTIVGVLTADRTLTAEGLIWLVASAGQTSDDTLVQDVVAYAHEHRLHLALPSSAQPVSCGLQTAVDGRDVLLVTRFASLGDDVANSAVAMQARIIEAIGFPILYAVVDHLLSGVVVLGGDPHPDANPIHAMPEPLPPP